MASSNKTQSSYLSFLERLNFNQYFPQKLTLEDALVITNRNEASNSNGITYNPHHLLHVMLELIKMSSYRFRNVLLCNDKASSNSDADSDASENEDTNEVLIHPMDALLALIHCADNFLRQDIFSKLVSCQMAVPLLLPDQLTDKIVLPLWAMRSIVKNWKAKTSDSTWTPCEGRLVECETRIVSFVRFSHSGNYSKSKIVNGVIADSKHDIFFNYECKGSSANRKFVDGLVETCWYLPTGEKSDVFNDIIMFTNLRGNAGTQSNSRQFSFLVAHSFILFVFILESDICPEQNLQRFANAKSKIFFLIPSCTKKKMEELKQLVPNSAIIELHKKAPADIVNSIRNRIISRVAKEKCPTCQLSNSLKNDHFQIISDENDSLPCCEGRNIAEKIKDEVKRLEAFHVKEITVPLQGPSLWHKWASHNKKQKRAKKEDTGNKKIDDFLVEQYDLKSKIRQQQSLKAKNVSFVMTEFIKVLLDFSPDIRAYFLQWLKFFLDDQSRYVLPKLQDPCKITREKLRNKSIAEEDKKKLEGELKIQDTRLVNASFGVEHLFRELGQIYESIMEVEENEDVKRKFKQLPKIVAQLLLSGQPLEVVDGDAAHIPLKWVQAVLDEVKSLVKNSKLYVLSVLGIQSTGKSTLMNTMFGVRFSVSVGRCTRGAYLQLLKVKSANTKCDYMLVIDTEGLRAPELDSLQTQQHDNELAALVIGLAGVTIVNMFGEVPADISDILQTTVHAFLRMKNAKMQHTPSCQFVRHHVANVSSSKTSEGSDRFQTTLDDMTKTAAKAEHLEGQYQQFSDVITFNNKHDVQNFPSLWEGNPPMAPVNPAYCEAAQKLRTKFLQLSNMPGSLCTLQDFQLRLSTLWDAILKENFVFSFKNTLEVEAFSSLDSEYGKWSWRLQSCVIKWESEVNNALSSADTQDLAVIQDEKIRSVRVEIDNVYEKIKVDFKAFFEDSPPMLAGAVIKWRAQYDIQLENLKNAQKQKAVQYCKVLSDSIKAQEKVNDMKDTERKRIDGELKKLVFEMDIKPDGAELKKEELEAIEKEFDSRWEQWMKNIEKEHPLPDEHNIHDQIIFCLRTHCGLKKQDQLLVEKEKQKSISKRGQLPVSIKLDPEKHLNVGKIQQMKSIFWSSDERVRKAEKATEIFLSEAQSLLAEQKDTLYDDHHIVSIVRKLVQSIDAFESNEEKKFTFTADYRIDLIMEVAGHALDVFTQARSKKN